MHVAMAARRRQEEQRKRQLALQGETVIDEEPLPKEADGLTRGQYQELRDLFDQFDLDDSGACMRNLDAPALLASAPRVASTLALIARRLDSRPAVVSSQACSRRRRCAGR